MLKLSNIEKIVEDARNGKLFVLVDDENRENEGDLIFPAQLITTDIINYTTKELPKWNPMNVCSYHLQEAGATPEQELSFFHHF